METRSLLSNICSFGAHPKPGKPHQEMGLFLKQRRSLYALPCQLQGAACLLDITGSSAHASGKPG